MPQPQTGAGELPPAPPSVFALPERLAAKASAALIAGDERHFAAIARSQRAAIADADDRLSAARVRTGGGQDLLERDIEIHRLTARLRSLRRFGLDLCLGHFLADGAADPVYIGRTGLLSEDGSQLLVDWRAPEAEPFFAATHARPMGLVRRRRYRWTGGRISDYWDEVFTPEGLASDAALDVQSAFIASLASSRSPRMRDVLGTIQSDQDAIIRAGSRGALVVDGGPGTGKTVVALHRAAYLLYSDPHLSQHRGGVLFVGPHRPYLSYVADVLPRLGEDGVRLGTLRDLVEEGESATEESNTKVAQLKSSAAMVAMIEAAVKFYEQPPAGLMVETECADIWVSPHDWAEAFAAVEPGTPHNEAREQIWEALLAIVLARHSGEDQLRQSLVSSRELRSALNNSWTLVDAADLVADLWSVPAYLRMCAPWLSSAQVCLLQRPDPKAWTVPDLPLLDAARRRLGDPHSALREGERRALLATERERRASVIDDAIAADDSELMVMSMLRGEGLQHMLVADSDGGRTDIDAYAGPFAHVVVDEAQELTPAQWQMLLQRCPSRSFTIVGDRAQARHGFTESWQERLAGAGFGRITVAGLSVNYRTPQEVMAQAEPAIREALPDANVPVSVRSSGIAVRTGAPADLRQIVRSWLDTSPDGIACVIGPTVRATGLGERVRELTPELAKGLEFDLVVLLNPARFGAGITGAVDRYVAMTRATQQLVILTSE